MRSNHGPDVVGVVADDLTGANDSAVHLAAAGWRVRIALGDWLPDLSEKRSALAVVSDARALDAHAARSRTSSAVDVVTAFGADRLFLKIDSTMRGSVADQIIGALDAWGAHHRGAFALICPAYPSMGRLVRGGRLLVDGVGVETTQAGRDPVTPVDSDRLGDLIPGSTSITLGRGTTPEHVEQVERALRAGRTIVVDAAADEDLAALARLVDACGPRAIPVGSAGLARALARVWPGVEGRDHTARATHGVAVGCVLVVVSSLHEASRIQYRSLVNSLPAGSVSVLEPPLDIVLDDDAIAPWIERKLAEQPSRASVIIVVAPLLQSSSARGHETDDGAPISGRVADGLAEAAASVFGISRVAAMVLVGGEGARAVLGRLGARSILVRESIREGLPVGVVEGGGADGITVVTKSGGFGASEILAGIVPELISGSVDPSPLTRRNT
ncbi:four-carbon acid sugar kinase family protein [Glaciibacter superstes]|uniref:four-carbon acid sugar kinase family protein n=1 Tax=Glaciibacter superstes TaxID=501023 RepID=UPI0003B79034|nr:four-carbon acid sugar kinase family protein [Glaciibacter superstes]